MRRESGGTRCEIESQGAGRQGGQNMLGLRRGPVTRQFSPIGRVETSSSRTFWLTACEIADGGASDEESAHRVHSSNVAIAQHASKGIERRLFALLASPCSPPSELLHV